MQLRHLGSSGLSVSALSLGTMNFGYDWHGIGAIDERTAASMVDFAIERGVTLFDTADIYGYGVSESMLGRLLQKRRHSVMIATKVLGQMKPEDPATGGLSARWIKIALEDSLRRLRTDYVDLYMPHAWDPRTPLDETLFALEAAVKAGKIRAVGCSNFNGEQTRLALKLSARNNWTPFSFNQVQYNLVAAAAKPNADLSGAPPLSLLAWSPLAGGLLSGKYSGAAASGRLARPGAFPTPLSPRTTALVDVLRRVAHLENRTCAQTAIGWILNKPSVASAVLGASTLAQLDELLDSRPISGPSETLLDRAARII